ncbi:hypothetical protein D1Z98_11270 [Riemerella anatipestifer]|uniref:hypothetical protein n=1 Tax=Riemerella anatipestifer TaxID=34085 RepID=UPI00129EB3FD|nr:hypothetical protein [Riemerella anatipestifer]MRM95501.1 hypothetical protein [Riemerella anatipestifer]
MYTELYKELADTIQNKIPEVLWIDLWHNQVGFLEEEFPFRTPAIFLSFRTIGTQDLGQLGQQVSLQIDFYLFYETFNDTYHGGVNQDSALEFLELKDKIHTHFHGSDGAYYSSMRRVGFAPEETGGAGNLYRISFSAIVQDDGAMSEDVEAYISAELMKDEDNSFFIPGYTP